MDKYKPWEQRGLIDLLDSESMHEIAFSIAKTTTKNLLEPKTITEAINIICLHSSSIHSILGRKLMTKEHIFRYLHNKNVPVTSDLNKLRLIDKLLECWQQQFDDGSAAVKAINDSYTPQQLPDHQSTSIQLLDYGQTFPINVLAREFAAWFFERVNRSAVEIEDLWGQCVCHVEFYERKIPFLSEEFKEAESVLGFLRTIPNDYQLYMNLNIDHAGTQGRAEPTGLVYVLACGTLHKANELVGTFETVFAISRDPMLANNWRIKGIKLRLNNFPVEIAAQLETPTLCDSGIIVPYLPLEMPDGAVNGLETETCTIIEEYDD